MKRNTEMFRTEFLDEQGNYKWLNLGKNYIVARAVKES